jgi:DNA-directed RNA polymerase subunit beta'
MKNKINQSNFFKKDFTTNQDFESISISIASSDVIKKWSFGEVKSPETINYRTFKPEVGGLFCQKIFGPVKDYECFCGKYKRIKYQGIICDRCGVEVTFSRVRRERMGHINLVSPITHIWFLKSMPSRLSLLLNISTKSLEKIVYYESYIVINPGKTSLKNRQLLTDQEYYESTEEFKNDTSLIIKTGSEALKLLLNRIDLKKSEEKSIQEIELTNSKQVKNKISKRLKVIQGFINSKTNPEWLVMNTLSVIPPDLRPLVPLEGGRFATSDLNDLYRRVINRNNRLKNLFRLETPDVIINNEKRMLQESVDALFDNGRQGKIVTGAGRRPLKSLSDMLKGKQGRFRQNLLGKRVDYSGRSVIVNGPELKLNQCGLPKKMALILFEPFIIHELKRLGFSETVRGAKKMIEVRSEKVWDILEKVTKNHPILLNRPPTLHRLSIQSFDPILIEGDAIRIHPLVCTPYNADFDGDQMAIHIPLSIESIMECKLLMSPLNNIFSPSSGNPILTPSQDIVIGTYYLTMDPFNDLSYNNEKIQSFENNLSESKNKLYQNNKIPLFATENEALLCELDGCYDKHKWVDFVNPDIDKRSVYGKSKKKIIRTTIGRIIFNKIIPSKLGFINFSVGKKKLEEIILNSYKHNGNKRTIKLLDDIKDLGYKYATKSGVSIGIDDMIIPKFKKDVIKISRERSLLIEEQYKKGIITLEEKKNKIINIWTKTTDKISSTVFDNLKTNLGSSKINPVYLMMDSGARGNKQQIRQLCGTRGLMAKPSGDIIERPILSSFKEGLSPSEYFISTHGARKGLADTALKTADAGYLTRKLCDVAMDCITVDDSIPNSNKGIWKTVIKDENEEIVSLYDRIIGRFSSNDLLDEKKEIIVKSGNLITEKIAKEIVSKNIKRVKVISPLTSANGKNIPIKSYGINLSTGKIIEPGQSVGIMAAQSIGEPGTQLTMRTFHVGGVANQIFKRSFIKSNFNGIIYYKDLKIVESINESLKYVSLNSGTIQIIKRSSKSEKILEEHRIFQGYVLTKKNGNKIKIGDTIASWDPYSKPLLAEKNGKVIFKDIIDGITIQKEFNELTGNTISTIIEHKEDLSPRIIIKDKFGKEVQSCLIPVNAQISVKNKDFVFAGSMLAKIPCQTYKTQDITGGLPRISELFEARRPKDSSVIAKLEGFVSIKGMVRGRKKINIVNENGEKKEHLISRKKHIIVRDGDYVVKGERITDGFLDPNEVLSVLGESAVQEYLLTEIQKVYRSQGVPINDKHIEIIICQMMSKVRILDPGDSDYYWGEQVDKYKLNKKNDEINKLGGKKANFEPILLGVTKASLQTDSFISAASFQETTRVLTDAAFLGKKDYLKGFKENVIMGRLIPAGTGFIKYRSLKIKKQKKD